MKHGFPESLEYRLKLALLSDYRWVFRVRYSLIKIAEDMYKEMNSGFQSNLLQFREFSINFSVLSQLTAVAVLLIILADPSNPSIGMDKQKNQTLNTPEQILNQNTNNFLNIGNEKELIENVRKKVKKTIGAENFNRPISKIMIDQNSIKKIIWAGSGNRTTDYL